MREPASGDDGGSAADAGVAGASGASALGPAPGGRAGWCGRATWASGG
jgi:hypothetical protein